MRFLKLAWLRWKRNTAAEELQMFQASHDVGPLYLVNVMQHIAELDREIERLNALRPSVPLNFKART